MGAALAAYFAAKAAPTKGNCTSYLSHQKIKKSKNEEIIMDIGTLFKLLALVLWPFVFLLLYFLLDRKGFMKKVDKIKQQGFK